MNIRLQNENRLIDEELRATGGNISRVSRVLGIDYFALKNRLAGIQSLQTFKPAMGPEPSDIRVLGRKGYETFVIAIKRAGGPWPEKYQSIIDQARVNFDAGTYEMFQTPNNGWVVLYSIPRLKPTEPPRVFSTMGSVE